MDDYAFSAHDEFLNRTRDLERMEDWWSGRDRNALALFGRRRVGKSWLFRELAHGKRALVLIGERRTQGAQLARFATQLAPHLGGVEPSLPDLAALFSVLYALAREAKTLVVIDEFPYLLPSREADRDDALTAVQAVMEEREASQLKLVLCGSHIGQMSGLLADSSPLRGRLTPLPIEPLRFEDAQAFLDSAEPQERIERFAVAGGMSLYLDELGRGGSLRQRVCKRVLDSRGPLFNDPREILEQDLRQPGTYFSLLESLAHGERGIADLATELGMRTADLGPYLRTLRDMRLVDRIVPVVASADQRFRAADPFFRFWFRFVFPHQDDLKTGLRADAHYASEIAPCLAEHVAPVFESLCREWTRRQLGMSRVGPWWGRALDELRRAGERQTEEVDVVGVRRGTVGLVGECKWTARPLSGTVLSDLETYKLPALRQARVKVSRKLQIVLFSRAGFTGSLRELAVKRGDLRLVDADELVADLLR